MTTYVMRGGRLVLRDRAAPRAVVYGAAPGVIRDEMDATRHMADGNYYTSKSAFRRTTRQYGCVEVGNDASMARPRKPVPMSREARREAIRGAIRQLRS